MEMLNLQDMFKGLSPSIDKDSDFKPNYVNYSSKLNDELACGSKPENRNEVVISSSYFKTYLKYSGAEVLEYSDVLNKKLYFKNYFDSPNWVEYLNTINIFDFISEVEIVGIIESNN